MYQLYYYPNNASLAPHFLLKHMGLKHDLIRVDRESNWHKSCEYLKLNPTGRIPALVSEGFAMFESAAICVHLCESHPEHGLMPAIGTPQRAQFLQWMMFLTNTLQAELMVRYYPERHISDSSMVDKVVAAQDERIGEALDVLDQRLQKQSYLCGDDLSACDFFLFMLSEWSLVIEQSPMTFPHLSSYLKRLSRLETIQTVCEIEGIDLSVFR